MNRRLVELLQRAGAEVAWFRPPNTKDEALFRAHNFAPDARR
jgi:hypothetical protein